MQDLRYWIKLVEEVNLQGAYYMHVSPGRNLRSILRSGLVSREGNYVGFETALDGVYVTCIPRLIQEHIFARGIEKHYVLVVVHVGTPAVIDEDALDGHVYKCLNEVAREHGFEDTQDLVEGIDLDDYGPIGREVAAKLLPRLGKLSPNAGPEIRETLDEYCLHWLYNHVGADEGDSDWWASTKDRLVRAFPELSHVAHGPVYSLRLPSPVGYEGPTRVVAVIQVKDGVPVVRKGAVPEEAVLMMADITG